METLLVSLVSVSLLFHTECSGGFKQQWRVSGRLAIDPRNDTPCQGCFVAQKKKKLRFQFSPRQIYCLSLKTSNILNPYNLRGGLVISSNVLALSVQLLLPPPQQQGPGGTGELGTCATNLGFGHAVSSPDSGWNLEDGTTYSRALTQVNQIP